MRLSVLLVLSSLVLAGCETHIDVKPTPLQAFAPWSDEMPPRTLQAGDEMDLRFLLDPELNDTKLVVGPDGRLTVPLIGTVRAAGFTAAEFRARLEKDYASKLRVPDLDVVVRSYGSERVYVGGEVKTPGVQALSGPTDVLQAVLAAGGFLNTARLSQVIVIRRRADHAPMLRTVNLQRYAGSADARDDVRLQSSDVIYVPKSGIAEFDLFVDQYLNQSLPFSKSFNYNSGNGATVF